MVELFCARCSAVKQFNDNAEIQPDNTVTCPDCEELLDISGTELEG